MADAGRREGLAPLTTVGLRAGQRVEDSEVGGPYGISDQTGVLAQTQADRLTALIG